MSGKSKVTVGQGDDGAFFTDAQKDFNSAFEDALLLERFDAANAQLEDLKKQLGETATYFYRLARLNEKQGKKKEAYAIFKKLYFEWPVFMHDKYDFERLRQECVEAALNKCRALWNQLIAKTSRFIEENPDAHDRESATPYAKSFWQSHNEELGNLAAAFMSILEVEPNDLSSITALIQCYTELKNAEHQSFFQDRAKEAKKHWSSEVAKRSDAIIAAAKKHEESAHYDSVIEVVNLGLETDPLNPDLLMSKAEALQKLKHLKESQACVVAVIKNHPANSRAHRLKKSLEGQIFDLNLREGLDQLNRAEMEKPGSPTQLARVEQALGRFLDALSFDGNNLTALAGVYRCHIRACEPLKAQKTMARIREIDSSFDIYSIFKDKNENDGKSELCFVATRVFGELHPNTVLLRNWRDERLRNYLPGRVFIRLYRRIGPVLAELPPGSLVLKLSRAAIICITRLLTFFRLPGQV
ncbi:MAG TPA: hypothetical protein PLM07_10175 [Candidatus Rifleibacterium sp.]|nr:hypothetical protein [Candidatus Rifleibacterium sp.]HPT46255.1 hypothetical protein [Candidatus Rifleibacterium sp.]